MKKLLTSAFALLFCLGAFAQGIDFQQISLKEALAKGAAENKPVFLDCYTKWCGPCKMMTNEVFVLKEAGDYFNKKFVNIKIDMEKGEGPEVAKEYGVQAYPTFLIINPDGSVLHKVVGSSSLEDFIARVEAGTDPVKTPEYLKNEYEKGTIDKKDLTQYWLLARSQGSAGREQVAEISEKLYGMLTKKDKLKKEYWSLLRTQAGSPDSEAMEFILANRKKFDKAQGAESVDNVISSAFSQTLISLMSGRGVKPEDYNKLPALKERMQVAQPKDMETMTALVEMADARGKNDFDGYVAALEQNAAKLPDMYNIYAIEAAREMAKGDKQMYTRLAETADKIRTSMSNERIGDMVYTTVQSLKRMANVGVKWEHFDSLDQALEQAKLERKPIFLDCYTTWCGPCQYMANTVFPQEEVGDFFNENFIPMKVDMEKGEGPQIAEKFGVRAYPTFVIISPDGSMRHTLVGGGEGPEFIERVKVAFDNDKALGVLQKKYEDGERDKTFLLNYMAALKDAYNPKAAEVATAIFSTLSDSEKRSKEYWMLFEDAELAPAGSEIESYLMANIAAFRNSVGAEAVDERIAGPMINKVMMVVAGRDKKTTAQDIDKIVARAKELNLGQANEIANYGAIAKLVIKGDKNAKNYKKLTTNMAPEENPFLYLYMANKNSFTPAQLKEWKAWGEELIKASDDDDFKSYLQRIL